MIVLKICYLLRTHIVWGSHMSRCKNRFFIHLSRKSKISNFNIRIFIKKHISRFEISMKNSRTFFRRIMTIRQSVRNLCNNFPKQRLFNQLIVSFLLFNETSKVASLTVLHQNVNFLIVLINNSVNIFHYERMLHFSQNIYLINKLILFLFIHLAVF